MKSFLLMVAVSIIANQKLVHCATTTPTWSWILPSNSNIIYNNDDLPPPLPALDCSSHYDTGDCRAFIPSYYYDASTNTCRRFVYGGCDGNNNRYTTCNDCIS